jgi:hypothetical protein
MNKYYKLIKHTSLVKRLRLIKSLLVPRRPEIREISDFSKDILLLRKAYDIYGYIKLESFFDKNQINILSKEYDALVLSQTSIALESTDLSPPTLMNELNHLTSFPEIIRGSPFIKVLRGLFGEDFKIIGSDLSTFRTGTELHRDTFSEFTIPKIGIYLSSSDRLSGGQMIFIPGSHRKDASFANNCSFGLKWPNGTGFDNNFWDNVLINQRGKFYLKINNPVTKVDIKAGDIIIFDQSLVHGTVQRSNKLRRMIAISCLDGFSFVTQSNLGLDRESYIENFLDFCGASFAVETGINGRKVNDASLDLDRYEFFGQHIFNDYEKYRLNFHFQKHMENLPQALEVITGNILPDS